MKRFVFACVLAAMICSCTEIIDYRAGIESEVLVMNSCLLTDAESHFVQLHRSPLNGKLTVVKDGRIDCYVNGELRTSAEYQADEHATMNGYYLNTEICEGDKVRLEATCGSLRASAEVTVPEAASIVSVDTLTVGRNPYWDDFDEEVQESLGDSYRFTLKLRDAAGDGTKMRLCLTDNRQITGHITEDPSEDRIVSSYSEFKSFQFDYDPVLRGEFHSSKEKSFSAGYISMDLATNSYCIFPDDKFRNTEYDATAYLGKINLRWSSNDKYSFPVTKSQFMEFKLLTITEDWYRHIYTYTNAKANGMLDNTVYAHMLYEPVIYPCNVEGGLGLVGAASVSSFRIDLPDIDVPASPAEE